jgi:GntR family transcriptional regulator / MocR family aminotransferase
VTAVAPQSLRRALRLAKHVTDWHCPIESTAGMHLTALLPPARHLSAEAVLTRTDGSGVAVNSVSEFYPGGATQCGLVLGYGAVALDRIENGPQLLWRLLDRP